MTRKINSGISFIAQSLIFINIATASDSLIPTAIKAQPSIVEVIAQSFEIHKAPKQQASFDPKSGRIILAQQAIRSEKTQHGAGVIIDSNGVIVTNLHTIYNSQKVSVKLHNGIIRKANILKLMPENDLALLEIAPTKDLQAIDFADSDKLLLGDQIIQIGNSYLLKGTISSGRVVGLAKPNSPEMPEEVELIKIDINLYKGDSGGPVLNKNGALIGMIEAKFVSNQNLTLVIPSNKIKKLYLEAQK